VSGDWHKTACSLCYVNCGLEVQTDGRAITRVRGDKEHPRSHGYLCQKAQRLTWYGDHADRLTTPLRRRPDGTHEAVDRGTALREIAARLTAVRDADREADRPSSFAYVGGGGQGNHSGGPYGMALLRWMGGTRFFNALSQEKTGDFWVNGRMFGAQTCHTSEGVEDCDLLVVIGCNPWQAHGFSRARQAVNAIRNDPGRRMIVVDPRRTETAEAADLHLPLRPGTDAYLLAAILALILDRGGEDAEFLAARTEGFPEVAAVLARVPVDAWIAHAELERADVERAVDMILAASAMSVRVELGIQQGRHSTLNSYLEKLLYLLTGHFGRPGTNSLHSWLAPLWGNSRGRRSETTGFEEIGGLLPASTLAEEVLTDHPHRVRALWVHSANPVNTYSNSADVERAIRACDLSVVVDVAYTETAALADYVLPAASQHERWEYTLFTLEWPVNHIHLRRPLFEPLPGTLGEAEMIARLFEELGVLPDAGELAALTETARSDRAQLMQQAAALMRTRPGLAEIVPVLLYRTLGPTLPDGAAAMAPLWPACHRAATTMPVPVQRALGSTATGPALGEELFDRVLTSPSGTPFTVHEPGEVWDLVRREKVQLAVPELLEWLDRLDPAAEAADPRYPFSLVNGQRRSHNANQILRPPVWRRTDPDGALRVRAADLASIGADDGDWVAVVTRAGRIVVRAEVDESMRPMQVALPHGYGMSHPDGAGGRVVDGPRINLLTDVTDRDPIAGTPAPQGRPGAARTGHGRGARGGRTCERAGAGPGRRGPRLSRPPVTCGPVTCGPSRVGRRPEELLDRGGEQGGVGDRDHVPTRGQGHRPAPRDETRQPLGPVARGDPVVPAADDQHRAADGGERGVDPVAAGRVHPVRHAGQAGTGVRAHELRGLPGPLVHGGAEPAPHEGGPARGTGVGRRPDEDEPGHALRRTGRRPRDDLAARRVPDEHRGPGTQRREPVQQPVRERGRVQRVGGRGGQPEPGQLHHVGPDAREPVEGVAGDRGGQAQPRRRDELRGHEGQAGTGRRAASGPACPASRASIRSLPVPARTAVSTSLSAGPRCRWTSSSPTVQP
jgi:anaerobic selenocysteine-containing dehydrogenase